MSFKDYNSSYDLENIAVYCDTKEIEACKANLAADLALAKQTGDSRAISITTAKVVVFDLAYRFQAIPPFVRAMADGVN